MSALVLLLGAGGGRDAAAAEKVPAFPYEQYSDAQGHFKYDGAALKLVKRPAHLEQVYEDAAREDARAKVLVSELEYWFRQAGVVVADTTTRPACLPLKELTPECQPNWEFLTEFLGDTPEAQRLRQVVVNAYEERARERGLQNQVIMAGVNLLLAGGMAKGVMNQAAAVEARGAARQALAAEAKAAQADARAAGQSGVAAGGIRFAQRGVSATFRHGEFAGKTIQEVAAGLRSGAISPNQLPLQTLTREGITYTLNNRSLMALRQAGLEPTIVRDVTGNAFFEAQLTQRLAELGGSVPPEFVPIIRGGP